MQVVAELQIQAKVVPEMEHEALKEEAQQVRSLKLQNSALQAQLDGVPSSQLLHQQHQQHQQASNTESSGSKRWGKLGAQLKRWSRAG